MRTIKFFFSTIFGLMISSYCQAQVLLKNVQGETIPFESLKGKWVLINYWASWCKPCIDEITALNQFYKANKSKVALFAVNYDGLPLSSQIALIKKHNIHYPSLQFDPAAQLNLGAINGVPATFIFTPEGKLQGSLYGGQSLKSLNRTIGN